MKKEGKIILTDINADRNREESIGRFQALLAAGFKNYATIKMSMNLFTMYEMSEEIDLERREEIEGYIDTINASLRCVYIDKTPADEETVNEVTKVRDAVTAGMKVLTAYTDALEIYEYILNRIEPAVLGTVDEDINVSELAENMYEFVFSENDKMLVNTRIQEFIAQLPVRMTKNRFFDIITNSIAIYKGGEKKSVDDFIQTIRDAAILDKPEGFETKYPKLYEIYTAFINADYKDMSRAEFDMLSDMITEGTDIIQSAVTDYLMITEIVNDALIVLYTDPIADNSYLGKEYETSSKIIGELVKADDIYEASAEFDELFVSLEGAQENAYEELSFLDSNLEDLYAQYYEMYESEDMKRAFDLLSKADRLTSTSLFMDIEDSGIKVVVEEADDIYIMEERETLITELDEAMKGMSKQLKRSVMAKILSLMPVFFNTQQEIKEYFEYALSSCSDKAELTACRDIVSDVIAGN